jgi:hypothetical protein
MQIETVFENNWRPKSELTFIVLGFEFRKHPKLDLIKLVFDFQKSGEVSTEKSLARFSFSKIYPTKKSRKWFSNLEKSEIEMIIIFKSKQELFSFAE